MKTDSSPRISSRKSPKQVRSTRLVADILEAAAHVLAREGAHRFTTARVAERAGVSVGSLYQYFPNKEAILFRLQTDEWQQTSDRMQSILVNQQVTPHERLRQVVQAFFLSECEEAQLRAALGNAAPLFRDAQETREQRKSGIRRVSKFMREIIPEASAKQRAAAADVVMTTMSAVGKQVSEEGRKQSEVNAFATIMGDMFCAYLNQMSSARR